MNTTGVIVDQIMDELNETDTQIYRPKIVKAVSKAFLEVASEHWWNAFMKTISLAVTSNATVLPSDLVKIKSVISSSDPNQVYYNSQYRGRAPRHAYVWYHDTAIGAVSILQGLDGTTANISNGSKNVSLSGGVLPADVAGEFVMFGAHEGIYEIASRTGNTSFTLTEAYRGETDTTSQYQIRPAGTKTISLADAGGDQVTDTVIITYLSKPLPLTEDWHLVPIPADGEPVYIKGLQISMRRRGWGRAASERNNDYDYALGKAKRLEPTNKEDLKPKPMFRRNRTSYTSTLPNLQGQ